MSRIGHQVLEYDPDSIYCTCQCSQFHAPIVVSSALSEDSPHTHINIKNEEKRYPDKCSSGQVLARLPLRLLGLGDGIWTVDTHDSRSANSGRREGGPSIVLGEHHWKRDNTY